MCCIFWRHWFLHRLACSWNIIIFVIFRTVQTLWIIGVNVKILWWHAYDVRTRSKQAWCAASFDVIGFFACLFLHEMSLFVWPCTLFGIFAKVTHMTISREYAACQDAECMLRCSTSRLLRLRSNIVCVSPKNFEIYSLECEYMMYSVWTVRTLTNLTISHEHPSVWQNRWRQKMQHITRA